jgi:membrane-associated protein
VQEWALALAGSPWIFVVLYLFAAIDGIFPPIPSESLVIALAALSMSQGSPNLAMLVLVAAAGAFTGDQIAYLVGSRVHVHDNRFLQSARARKTVDWAENALQHRGSSLILAARYIPVGRVAVNMTAGALGYPHRRFVGLTAVAGVMWALYATLLGVGAGAWLGDHPLVAVVVGVVAGIVMGVAVDWVLRHWSTVTARLRARSAVVPERDSVTDTSRSDPAA